MKVLIAKNSDPLIERYGVSAYRENLGFLLTPETGGFPDREVEIGATWGIDNSAYSKFSRAKFISLLKRTSHFASTCQFVAVPDVVGDSIATLTRFHIWKDVIRYLGEYPLALVAQDGLESLDIPWRDFSCLFIGGAFETRWKESPACALLIIEAKQRGKWVHMGRVNSVRRLKYARSLNIDSVDGSGLAKFTDHHLSKTLPELRRSRQLSIYQGD